jgi:hypothetical protein
MPITQKQYDYYTYREDQYGGVTVHGFGTYPESSVLAGQPMKVFIDSYGTLADALADYPDAAPGSEWTDPQVNLNHLPGDDDPDPFGDFEYEEEF